MNNSTTTKHVLTLSPQMHYNRESLLFSNSAPMSTIQVRIDQKTKRAVKKILDKVGMDMSGAIKVYFHQILIQNGLPFQVLTENGLTVEQEEEILKASEEAKRGINTTGPMDIKEAIAHLNKLKKNAK